MNAPSTWALRGSISRRLILGHDASFTYMFSCFLSLWFIWNSERHIPTSPKTGGNAKPTEIISIIKLIYYSSEGSSQIIQGYRGESFWRWHVKAIWTHKKKNWEQGRIYGTGFPENQCPQLVMKRTSTYCEGAYRSCKDSDRDLKTAPSDASKCWETYF